VTWLLRGLVAVLLISAALLTHQQMVNGDHAREARDLGRQIQSERARNIRTGCADQNARHDNTIRVLDQQLVMIFAAEAKGDKGKRRRLDALVARAKAASSASQVRAVVGDLKKLLGKAMTAQIDQARDPNVFIIDAVAPRHDCDALVRAQVDR
jgi:hypothetical protein